MAKVETAEQLEKEKACIVRIDSTTAVLFLVPAEIGVLHARKHEIAELCGQFRPLQDDHVNVTHHIFKDESQCILCVDNVMQSNDVCMTQAAQYGCCNDENRE